MTISAANNFSHDHSSSYPPLPLLINLFLLILFQLSLMLACLHHIYIIIPSTIIICHKTDRFIIMLMDECNFIKFWHFWWFNSLKWKKMCCIKKRQDLIEHKWVRGLFHKKIFISFGTLKCGRFKEFNQLITCFGYDFKCLYLRSLEKKYKKSSRKRSENNKICEKNDIKKSDFHK